MSGTEPHFLVFQSLVWWVGESHTSQHITIWRPLNGRDKTEDNRRHVWGRTVTPFLFFSTFVLERWNKWDILGLVAVRIVKVEPRLTIRRRHWLCFDCHIWLKQILRRANQLKSIRHVWSLEQTVRTLLIYSSVSIQSPHLVSRTECRLPLCLSIISLYADELR